MLHIVSYLCFKSYPFASQSFREKVVHAVPFQVTMLVYPSCWHIFIVVVYEASRVNSGAFAVVLSRSVSIQSLMGADSVKLMHPFIHF